MSEAYQVGAKAARIALEGEGGFMATIIRAPGTKYQVVFDKVLLKTVANAERKFPTGWIAQNRIDVTEDFIKWALPLLGGPLPVFTNFKEVFAPNLCGKYIPFAYRK